MRDGEEWRPVPDWPRYEVSSLGRVRRLAGFACKRTRLLKVRTDKRNRGVVTLSDRGRHVRSPVHRLVLCAFVGPPPTARHETAHEDGDRLNNRLDNLSWKLPVAHAYDKWRHGTQPFGETHPNARFSGEQIEAMRFLGDSGFPKRKIARVMGCPVQYVRRVVARRYRMRG